jgi:hypothetical protein
VTSARNHLAIALAIRLAPLALAACGTAEAAGESAGAARRADLAAFRRGFFAKDRSYSAPARAEAEARLAKLERDADSVGQPYFELELGRIVALADNGHTVLSAGVRSRHFDRIPLRLVPFGADFAVLRAREPHADLLGAQLLAVDGRPLAEVRDVGRTLHGGLPAWRDRFVPYFLESPEQMHALGVAGEPGAATYRFRLPDGREIERRLAAEAADPGRPRANADRWMFPAPMREEGTGWRPALDPARVPWSLRDPDQPFRWREAPELAALVIELRQNADGERRTIDDFLDEVTRRLQRTPPTHLVLDMRANGGGDLTTTRGFMQTLAGRVAGRIFVLTSPWTFSAAISSVGYLEQSAPGRVIIVGEPVGDRLDFFSEGEHVELSRSGLVVLHATERHDYRNGCRAATDCHRHVVRHPIAVPTLAPDVAAPWTVEAYLAGRDPGMEAVERELRR